MEPHRQRNGNKQYLDNAQNKDPTVSRDSCAGSEEQTLVLFVLSCILSKDHSDMCSSMCSACGFISSISIYIYAPVRARLWALTAVTTTEQTISGSHVGFLVCQAVGKCLMGTAIHTLITTMVTQRRCKGDHLSQTTAGRLRRILVRV